MNIRIGIGIGIGVGVEMLLSMNAFAASPNIQFDCVPDHSGTVLIAKTQGERVSLLVHHDGGADRIPIMTEAIYPPELSWLERLTAVVKQLGPSYQLGFDLKDCAKTARDQVNCLNRSPFDKDGITVNRTVFYTSETVQNALGMHFQGHSVHLSMDLNSLHYQIDLNYPEYGCHFQ